MKNKLNNMPLFYVGQKVVYITGISMPKNSIHTVSDYVIDPCGCHRVYIDGEIKIVNKGKNPNTSLFRCIDCGTVYPKSKGISHDYGWKVSSFRAVQEQSYPLMTFSKIVEKEKEEILINN